MSEILEQYKKTFFGMQAAIAAITIAVFLTTHHMWVAAAVFFGVMQVGSFVGAAWAIHLRRKVLHGLVR